MIELQHVSRTYHKNGTAVPALRDVSLCVDRGEFTAIMGPSGSGKSTLMNIIGLLDRPDEGVHLLDGIPIAGRTADELAQLRNERIGFVFQAFHLMARATARENVELPLLYSKRRDIRGLARAALERVGLGDRAEHLPGELSGGQQQRVAIARALVQQPDLILADEPTGNLDSSMGHEILELFRELNEAGTTILMITHDPLVAARAGRTLTIVDGRLTTSPSPLSHEAVV